MRPMGPKSTVRATAAPTLPSPSLPLVPRSLILSISDDQVFQSQVQFAALPHHAGLLCVRDRSYCLRTGFAHRCIANLQVFVEHQIYGVIIVGGLRAQVLGKL